MSDIVLSAGVRQNLLALQNTAKLMSVTQNRLATGKKVNTALDNPVNFFTAAGLNSRARDLSALLDAMSNGIKTIEAADNGITAINKTIESMKSTLLQARQDKSFKSSAHTVDTAAIGQATAKNLTFAGGSVGTTPVSIPLNTVDTAPATQSSVTAAADYVPPGPATAATLVGNAVYTGGTGIDYDAGSTTFQLTINDGTQSRTINITVDASADTDADTLVSLAEFNAAVIAQIDADGTFNAGASAGPGVDVVVDSSGGAIRIAMAATGAGTQVNIAAFAETTTAGTSGLSNETNSGTTPSYTVQFTTTPDVGSATNINVTLTAANGGSVAAAIATINAARTAAGVSAADFTAQVDPNDSGRIQIVGSTAGTNDITLNAGDDAEFDSIFGNARTVVAGAAGSGDGDVRTVDELVAAINVNTSLTGKVQASNDNGRLRIMNLSTTDLTVAGINGSGVIDGSATSTTIGGNDVRRNLVKQFNDLRDQLDKLADDASFNGVNLLRGDKLKITFNETGTSTIEVQAKDELGVVRPINSINLDILVLQNTDVDADANIDALLDGLGQSLNIVRSQASDFGSKLSIVENRTEFTNAMINTLKVGADTLVLADPNEEGANMLALQTRQQLSTTALSLASQADQAVLRLFG